MQGDRLYDRPMVLTRLKRKMAAKKLAFTRLAISYPLESMRSKYRDTSVPGNCPGVASVHSVMTLEGTGYVLRGVSNLSDCSVVHRVFKLEHIVCDQCAT